MFERLQSAFPDYPVETLPAIPETWRDTSWCNDTCPSFEAPNGLIIYLDYADPALRECAEQGEAERFSVLKIMDDGTHDQIFWGDDWDAILDYVGAYQ